MRTQFIALSVLVFVTAGSLRADVAPFPSWRLAANDTITSVVQGGDVVYVGGRFSRLGEGLTPFVGAIDRATLAFAPRTGCATETGNPIDRRYLRPRSVQSLADGAGPFPVPAGTVLVRVDADCRFDRRFRVVLPPGIDVGNVTVTDPVEANGHAYFRFTRSTFPRGGELQLTVEVDGVTGAMQRYWPEPVGTTILPHGVTPAGRIVASATTGFDAPAVGWFDPDAGGFQPVRTLPSAGRVAYAGDVVIASQYGPSGTELLALDPVALAPLPQWPVVQVPTDPVLATGGGIVYVASSEIRIGGVVTSRLVAFDATSGARLDSFAAPSWIDRTEAYISDLFATAGRLLVVGAFPPDAPRDTVAALDAVSGSLDPWVLPYAVSVIRDVGGTLHLPFIPARERVARTGLAAVDVATGAVRPWSSELAGVTSLALDAAAGHLYAARPGEVRRVSVATGAVDATWRLEARDANGNPAHVSGLLLHAGTLYVAGMFAEVRDAGGGPWVAREGLAAATTAGAVTPWRVRLAQPCYIVGNPPVARPCVDQLVSSEGRIVLAGRLESADGAWSPVRSAMAVTADSGAIDPLLPPVDAGLVTSIAEDGAGLYAVVRGTPSLVAHVTALGGARFVAALDRTPVVLPPPALAVRDGRIYGDVERDAVTGAPTGNDFAWANPRAMPGGIAQSSGLYLDWMSGVAAVPPRPPVNLAAAHDGARLTLRWAPGPGDLAPLVTPTPPGGTAATSHIVVAALAPGGPPVAQFETASSATSFSITAPTGTFYLRVQAKNAFGTSAPSAEVRVDVQPQPPNPPLAIVASVSGRTVHLEWQAPPLGWPATSYRLEAGTAPGLSNVGALPVSGTTFDAVVPPGRYYVRIRAVNAYGASVPGDEVILDVP